MSTITEYLPLIQKLVEKTKERKIEWKGTYESTTFICVLEGQYTFEIEKGKTSSGNSYRRLSMKDAEEGDVFALRATSPSSSSSDENDLLFSLLEEMYDRARIIALNIDKKVNAVNDILDKI
jgi:hypothetical protein